jgi:hypothetical protein
LLTHLRNALPSHRNSPVVGAVVNHEELEEGKMKWIGDFLVGELKTGRPGTDVMILKIFSPNFSTKKLAFFTQNKDKLCKILIITSVFEKNVNFFGENCQKSQKIMIIASTPD